MSRYNGEGHKRSWGNIPEWCGIILFKKGQRVLSLTLIASGFCVNCRDSMARVLGVLRPSLTYSQATKNFFKPRKKFSWNYRSTLLQHKKGVVCSSLGTSDAKRSRQDQSSAFRAPGVELIKTDQLGEMSINLEISKAKCVAATPSYAKVSYHIKRLRSSLWWHVLTNVNFRWGGSFHSHWFLK